MNHLKYIVSVFIREITHLSIIIDENPALSMVLLVFSLFITITNRD
jgi:hypothetical protein